MSNLEARIDRLESLDQIRQLPAKYALALDMRDMDAMGVPEHVRTARALARLAHGVASAAFPADRWRTHALWGRHAELDFDGLLRVGRGLFQLQSTRAL
mgnify:CR=1 FL=1